MATITETEARVEVRLVREIEQLDGGSPTTVNRVRIVAVSYDAEGNRVRTFNVMDLFPQLSAARQAQVIALLDDAITFVRNQLQIT